MIRKITLFILELLSRILVLGGLCDLRTMMPKQNIIFCAFDIYTYASWLTLLLA